MKPLTFFFLVSFIHITVQVQADLVAYYPFDEGNGLQAFDASGHTLTGYLFHESGSDPSWITGVSGGALQFGQTQNDHNFVVVAYVPLLDLNRHWSFTAWVRLDHNEQNHGAYGGLFFCPNYSVQMGSEGDRQMYFWPSDITGDWQFGLGIEPPLGQWHHLAFTYDGEAFITYVDGAPVFYRTGLPASLATSASIGWDYLFIGCYYESDLQRWFSGAIDDFSIWNETLTSDQINTIMTSGVMAANLPLADPINVDLAENGWIDIDDLAVLCSFWLTDCYTIDCHGADVDVDGFVDYADIAALTSYWQAKTSLYAYWRFDEGQGNAVSEEVFANQGTRYGASWISGQKGNALSFDGVNDYVVVADAEVFDLTNALTLSTWIYLDTAAEWSTIVSKFGPNQRKDFYWWLHGNEVGVSLAGVTDFLSGGDWFTGLTLPAQAWTHLTLTYDGTRVRLYQNGLPAATLLAPGTLRLGEATSTAPFYIGKNTVWGEYLRGRVDEMRLYHRVLTAEEILNLAQTDVPLVTTSSSQAYYPGVGAVNEERYVSDEYCAWKGQSGASSWWWRIRFNELQSIGSILQIIGDHDSNLQNAPRDYIWQWSLDGDVWHNLPETQVEDERRLYRIHRLNQSVVVRYLRLNITQSTGNYPTLREVEFYPQTNAAIVFPDWLVGVSIIEQSTLPQWDTERFFWLARESRDWQYIPAQQIWVGNFDESFLDVEPYPLCAFLSGSYLDWCQRTQAPFAGLQDVLDNRNCPVWGACGGCQVIGILEDCGWQSPWECPYCQDPENPTCPIYGHILKVPGYSCGNYPPYELYPQAHERGPTWIRQENADPVFAGLTTQFLAAEWHLGELKYVPAGYTRVATAGTGAKTAMQCMKANDAPIYAAQFHIELQLDAGAFGSAATIAWENAQIIMSNFLDVAAAWGGYQPD